MERAIKEKMTTLDIESAMPQDLINAKPLTVSLKDFAPLNFHNLWIKLILYQKLLKKKSFGFRARRIDKRKSWI